MKSLASFWSACEKLASSGVMREWELEILDKGVFDAAKQLLTPTSQASAQYPCTATPRCACVHEVVEHRDGSKSACCVCDEPECSPIPITEDDLMEYQVDFPRVLRGLAKVSGLEIVPLDNPDTGRPIHFGDLRLNELSAVPAFFVITGPKGLPVDALIDLIARDYQPVILFTISPVVFHINTRNQWYHESRLFISIEQLLSVADDGRLAVSRKLRTTIEEFAKQMSAASKGEQVRSACAESEFLPSNDYHTIVLRGKQFPHLTPLQADVARILHQAHLRGQQDVKYAVISCEIADSHPDERGYGPPSKMSQIFRKGDPRSELVISAKPGYYRLNI